MGDGIPEPHYNWGGGGGGGNDECDGGAVCGGGGENKEAGVVWGILEPICHFVLEYKFGLCLVVETSDG